MVFHKEQPATGAYAIPSPSGDGMFLVFKLVSLHPERRSYFQRAFALARDAAWSGVWSMDSGKFWVLGSVINELIFGLVWTPLSQLCY